MGQVSMRTNLLHTIPLHKSVTFEVRLNKGALTNFSKLQVEVPQGLTVKEVESRQGNFEYAESKAKIIWVTTPVDSMVSVRMKIGAVHEPLDGQIVFKYFFMVDDDKREYESKPFNIRFKDTTLPVFMSAPMTVLKPLKAPLVPAPDSNKFSSKTPLLVSQQVEQLRKDSKEARAVGNREKEKAMRRLDSLDVISKQNESITDEAQRKQADEEVASHRKKIQEELTVAERVLTLSQTLENQASEIERLGKKVNVAAKSPQPK
jgi:hypothetical protein